MWKQITGYEGIYEVSSEGKVRNMYGKVLKTYIINSGYECIKLYKNQKAKAFLVHRLVGREFCEGFSEELDIDHINNERLDNRADNLQWVTRKENIRDCVIRGVNSIKKAREFIDNTVAVEMLDRHTEEPLKTFKSIKEAALTVSGKPNGSHITAVCKGNKKTAYGYKWRYI